MDTELANLTFAIRTPSYKTNAMALEATDKRQDKDYRRRLRGPVLRFPNLRIPDKLASIGEFGWKIMLLENLNLNLNLALNHNLRGIKIKITIKIKKKATTPFSTNQVV